MLGYLAGNGYILTDDYLSADVIFINTCAFIEDARQESVNTILEMVQQTRAKRPRIIAAGCLVEVFGNQVLESIPGVDGAIGVHSYRELDRFMAQLFAGERPVFKNPPSETYHSLSSRVLTSPEHSVNVKIADGCNNRCHYCMIPSIRGPYRSREPRAIVNEINDLLVRGAAEINLIAQDTTAYGIDQPGYPDLSGLLEQILALDHDFSLRIMYTYPSRIDERLIELIGTENRICKYLDIPIQHSSDRILELMGRHYGREELQSLFEKLRRRIPELALRTTVMVGYPGERSRHFQELLGFIEKYPFESLGSFIYSQQEGTPAAGSEALVPTRVSRNRQRALMLKQKRIARKVNQKYSGTRLPILVEGKAGSIRNLYYGRTEYQAPEVDGITWIRSAEEFKPGSRVSAVIKAVGPYNLLAVKPVLLDRMPR